MNVAFMTVLAVVEKNIGASSLCYIGNMLDELHGSKELRPSPTFKFDRLQSANIMSFACRRSLIQKED